MTTETTTTMIQKTHHRTHSLLGLTASSQCLLIGHRPRPHAREDAHSTGLETHEGSETFSREFGADDMKKRILLYASGPETSPNEF